MLKSLCEIQRKSHKIYILIWANFGLIREPSKCFRTQSKEEKRETVALAQTVFCFFLKLESFFEMIVDTQEGKLKFEIRSSQN
jgi:hypothetical protein